jgi:nicotinamide mononucleotide transporter PnuC
MSQININKPKKVWWKYILFFWDWSIFEKSLLAINFFISWTFLILALSNHTDFSAFNDKDISWNVFSGNDGLRVFFDILSFVTSMVNICCLILISRKAITNFIWGLCAVLLLGFFNFIHGNIGTTITNWVIQVPMNILGLVMWKKTSQNNVTIKPRELNWWQKLIVVLILVLLTTGFYFLFSNADVRNFVYHGGGVDEETIGIVLDGMILAITLCAIVLLVLKCLDQWYLWIFCDLALVIMYAYQGNWQLLITWACGLVNACYGLYMWKFKERKTAKSS